jgi:hypothetical protein
VQAGAFYFADKLRMIIASELSSEFGQERLQALTLPGALNGRYRLTDHALRLVDASL